MKKSKIVKLVIVAGLLISGCSHKQVDDRRLYIRGDEQDDYSPVYGGSYFHFYPMMYYNPGYGYIHGGYASRSIRTGSINTSRMSRFNSGSNVTRGGFGRSGIRAGS